MHTSIWRKRKKEHQIKGYSKIEVLKRLEKLGDDYEIVHPMKSYFNSPLARTVYYITVRRKDSV